MTRNYIYSLLAVAVVVGDAMAGIRVGNLSRNYAGSAKNTLGLEQQYYNSVAGIEADVPVDVALPIPVANKDLAEQIKSGDENANTDMETLNRCAMIYPDGEFVWDKPTIGRGAGGAATCVSVVEVRALVSNGNTEYTTVARGKLAAGDSIRCNISDFPAATYLPDISRITFPADNKPTRDDVIRVMNEEQKSKAGLKIAAAALVGGLGGNMVGKNELGEDKLLGTNSDKLKTTAIGAAAAAALMTASTYSGKVAGDVILHTGVNAAAGSVVGNMAATGDSVLRVTKCVFESRETTCLWGNIQKTKVFDDAEYQGYVNDDGSKKILCKKNKTEDCSFNNGLIVSSILGKSFRTPSTMTEKEKLELENTKKDKEFHYVSKDKKMEPGLATDPNYQENYYEATLSERAGAAINVVIVDFPDSAFGVKDEDWRRWKSANGKTAKICRRGADGNPTNACNEKEDDDATKPLYTLDDFNPLKVEVEDGGVVDFSNKARLGSTLKGAGIGGALGGFSGYQGAQSDIEERLSQALREYNDSLEKIYCGTGKKFLSFYNDDATIPTMR